MSCTSTYGTVGAAPSSFDRHSACVGLSGWLAAGSRVEVQVRVRDSVRVGVRDRLRARVRARDRARARSRPNVRARVRG